jgi:hypothetical protein
MKTTVSNDSEIILDIVHLAVASAILTSRKMYRAQSRLNSNPHKTYKPVMNLEKMADHGLGSSFLQRGFC